MASVNKFFGVGRLGRDPELRTTPSGVSVANVSMAVSEYYKDQQGNRQEKTEWINLVFWKRQAEVLAQYCRKGSQIFVEGSLQTRKWTDKDNNERHTTEIIVRNLQLLDPKQDNGGQQHQQNQGYQQQQQSGGFGGSNEPIEDDVPF